MKEIGHSKYELDTIICFEVWDVISNCLTLLILVLIAASFRFHPASRFALVRD